MLTVSHSCQCDRTATPPLTLRLADPVATQNKVSNPIRQRFAQALRELRRASGFKTARKFASALGIDENRYTRYERAEVEPDLELITRFCETLGVSPNRLLGEPEPSDKAVPGFAQEELGSYDKGSDAIANGGQGGQFSAKERVRIAAWRLATTRARMEADPCDPASQLRLTASLFDQILKDPVDFAARLAKEPQVQEARRADQEAIAQDIDALVRALNSFA